LPESSYTEAVRQEEINKVCFIGSPDKTRIGLISLLAQNGFAVDIYGNRWDKKAFRGYSNVAVHPAVLEQEFWNKLRQYRVQLNIFRKHNIGSHNMRTMEVPAVGGILLTPFSGEQAGFFEEGKEVFFFRNEEELLQKVKTILSMPEEKAGQVRENARHRSLANGHSYAERAKTVFDTFRAL
jgi:spore maturation protein CgeB